MTVDQIIIRIIEISLGLYIGRKLYSWLCKKSFSHKTKPLESKKELSGKKLNLFYKCKSKKKAYAAKESLKIDRATESRERFFHFINKCNEYYRFRHELLLYRELIESHRKIENLKILIEDDIFITKIYQTLDKWNMNQRRASLASPDDFKNSVRFWKDDFIKLYQYRLSKSKDIKNIQLKETLEKIFCNIKVMESKRRIVGVSKALHFLLPDLIMPIDGKFTLPAFFGYNKLAKTSTKEFIDFWYIFQKTIDITERLELTSNDVDGVQWNTSVPKLIDNAIIGLYKSEEK